MADGELPVRRFGVGYALLPKKENSFIQDSLLNLAKEGGIDLIKIDTSRPLVDQGPFDCVLHKLYGDDWRRQLVDYEVKNPNALIIDSPEAIERLHNRISMLQVVSDIRNERAEEEDDSAASFGIPRQIVIYEAEALLNPTAWDEGLTFPVIAKPLVADGSAKSHKMSLIFNHDGLNKLKPPTVLQEFVNHGGVIFKVYVVGDYVKCMKRKSLPDVTEEKLSSLVGSLSFCQVSNLTQQEKNDDKYYKMMNLEDIEMPPRSLVTDIARGLRMATKLHLFNFDVIRDTRVGNRYLVIDINYFPGYAKMPGYESVLTDFFWDVLNKKQIGFGSRKLVKKMVGNNGCSEDEGSLPGSPLKREEENPIQRQSHGVLLDRVHSTIALEIGVVRPNGVLCINFCPALAYVRLNDTIIELVVDIDSELQVMNKDGLSRQTAGENEDHEVLLVSIQFMALFCTLVC